MHAAILVSSLEWSADFHRNCIIALLEPRRTTYLRTELKKLLRAMGLFTQEAAVNKPACIHASAFLENKTELEPSQDSLQDVYSTST